MGSLGSVEDASRNHARNVEGYDVDEDFIRKGLEEVDTNALRLTLYQITGDKELGAMAVSQSKSNGGAFIDYVLSAADQAVVRNKAQGFFRQARQPNILPPLSKEETFRLMDLFSDVPMASPSREVGFDYEEGHEQLAFEDFPRDVKWTNDSPLPNIKDWKVAIIGAGVSGIAAAISVKRLGIPFNIIERQGGIGGTWRLNRYLNVRVDSLAFLYQYTFTKNYKWSEYFPTGGEILAYLEYVATNFGLSKYCKFNHEVVAAKWDEITSKWIVTLKNRDGEATFRYNVIVSASGLFSTPNSLPDIKCITSYKGPIFHTSQWPDIEYQGKNIALIETGSTGTQLAPALAHSANSLTVFQRTANWIIPFEDFKDPVTDHTNWIHDHMPYYWHWYIYGSFFKTLGAALVQYRDDDWTANGGLTKLSDRPDLVTKVTPRSAPFVRRIVVDNGFYDAIKLEHVDLVTDTIDRITETGIRMQDGTERDFDLIVLGAGFKVSHYFWPVEYRGRGGMTLEKGWEKDGARSYLGMVMPSYPNLFTLYGPNHQPRGGSLPSYAEIWSRYMASSLVGMIEKGVKSMKIKREVFDKYQTEVDLQTSKLIWESEGAGYFLNKHGRQQVNMPWTNAEYFPMIKKVNLEEFNFT